MRDNYLNLTPDGFYGMQLKGLIKKGDQLRCVETTAPEFYEVGDIVEFTGFNASIVGQPHTNLSGCYARWEIVGEKKMKFVEEKTVVTRKVVDTRDIKLSNGAQMSVVPTGGNTVNIVVGARYEDNRYCNFSKSDIGMLIQELQSVRDAL